MYEHYLGLTEKPFSLTPDPKFLFLSPRHRAALECMRYGLARREGFMVVTGDIGTGKTTLCRALLQEMDDRTFTALLLNPYLSTRGLLVSLLRDLGLLPRDSSAHHNASVSDLVAIFHEFLLSIAPLGGRVVVVIDEAQNLPLHVLEQLRVLSNLETDTDKLLQIILVGQLNLLPLLKSEPLRQLDQRISLRCTLEPLATPEEVDAYITHRLFIARGHRVAAPMPRKAVRLIHQYSSGVPRLINLLCDRALAAACAARSQEVTAPMVRHAAGLLGLQPQSALSRPIVRIRWAARRAAATAPVSSPQPSRILFATR